MFLPGHEQIQTCKDPGISQAAVKMFFLQVSEGKVYPELHHLHTKLAMQIKRPEHAHNR
jgi:hypothetical protein